MDFNNPWYNVTLSDADAKALKAEASTMTAKEMSVKYGVSEFKVRQVLRENNIKPLVPKRAEVRIPISHWARTFNACNSKNSKLLSIYYNMRRRHSEKWNFSDCTDFYQWAKDNGYKEGAKLSRIDRDKEYSPDNCKWV